MATLAQLQTRMTNSLGMSQVTAVAQAQLREALNQAVARLADDGLPGLITQYLNGETYGSSTLTISSHSADSSQVTFASLPDNTYPGDVVQIGSNRYLIYNVVSSTVLDFGAPIPSAITESTATLVRRSIKLPNQGRLMEVISLDYQTKLDPTTGGLEKWGLENHDSPSEFSQGYDGTDAYVTIWPVINSAHKFGLRMSQNMTTLAESTELGWPDNVDNLVIAKALDIWRGFRVGGISPVEAQLSSTHTRDAGTAAKASAPAKPFVRKK